MINSNNCALIKKVAVVTGANKGIGFEIAKKLGAAGCKTILAARNTELGNAATLELKSLGYDVEYRQLDISDNDSISSFCDQFAKDFGSCDILVNNAAIAFKGSDPTPFREQAEPTIHTNFFGTLSITESLLPIISRSPDPRVITIASMAGMLRILPSEEMKNVFSSTSLTKDRLVELMQSFVLDVKNGNHRENGWPNTCYGMSKLGVVALTKVMARNYPSISFTCCCPGYCNTDMTSHLGPRSSEHGARTPAMLALMSRDDAMAASGKYFQDEIEKPWSRT